MAEAKLEIGGRITLAGNIRPAETMMMGTSDTVENNVKECLRKGHDSPRGYILALGCELPIKTPPDNFHALSRAARKCGCFHCRPELWDAPATLAGA